MAKQWPSFVTRDLGDSEEDSAEMLRRWKVYDQEMKALIAAGGVHQDADGWWVDDKTGELIGPDPDLERPLEEGELANMRPFREIFPDLAASMDREVAKRGRPPLEKVKTSVTIRLDPDIVAHYKATGKGWQSRMNDDLRKATGL